MMYDMLDEPPAPGSPLESLMILVWRKRADIDYFLARAICQSNIDAGDEGKAANNAWKEYTDMFFPYMQAEEKRSDAAALNYLMKEVKKGALGVRPLMPLVKSRMSNRRVHEHANDKYLSQLRKREGERPPE